jgi:small subunit ribosomal protein S5
VRNVLAKVIGPSNPINVVQAMMKGLSQMVSPEEIAAKRGKTVEEITS